MNKIINALSQCQIFDGLNPSQIETQIATVPYRVCDYDKNQFISREDQHSVNIGIIIYGCIEIQKVLPSGNVICIFHKNSGSTFGGSVVFSSKSVYPCDVFSRDKSQILFFHKNSFIKLCQNPMVAENLLTTFANQILYYEKRLELFAYSSIQKKIAFYLLNEMKLTHSPIIHLPFTKTSWAEYLNVSRPSLSRELKKLASQGIIRPKTNNIVIINQYALECLLR